MILPTASQLDLASACLYPWTSGIQWSRIWSDDAATHGTRVHALAAELARGRDVQLAGETDAVVEQVLRVAEVLEADAGASVMVLAVEPRFAWSPSTGRADLLGEDDPLEHDEISGHADLVLATPHGVVVRDWKTGPRARRHSVERSAQVAFYALAAASIWGANAVTVELAHVGGPSLWVDRAELDAMDLGARRAELRQLVARIGSGQELPRLGPHCRDGYCPIASSCPAGRALALRAAEAVALPMPEAHAIESDEMAADILERLPLAEAYLDALRLAVREYVAARGVVQGASGARWGAVEHQAPERLALTEQAEAILRAAGLDKAIELERSASKASLERAARARLGTTRGVKQLLGPVLEQLRRHGALRRGAPHTQIETIREETTT